MWLSDWIKAKKKKRAMKKQEKLARELGKEAEELKDLENKVETEAQKLEDKVEDGIEELKDLDNEYADDSVELRPDTIDRTDVEQPLTRLTEEYLEFLKEQEATAEKFQNKPEES